MNFLQRLFSSKKGSTSKTYVPLHKYSESQKKYINTNDILSDKNRDFQQIVSHFLSVTGARAELQQMDYGSEHDAYRILNYMESAINALSLQLETTIQSEFRCREEILELDNLYETLTTLALTEDQKAELLAYEQLHKDDFFARATTAREKNIIEGHTSTKNILQAQHELHPHKIQTESDKREMAETKSANFKTVAQSEQKNHHQRKINQHPEQLSTHYLTSLQRSLDGIKHIQNGEGAKQDIESVHSESAT